MTAGGLMWQNLLPEFRMRLKSSWIKIPAHVHVSPPVFRKQCWAWSCSRAAGGGPSSRGVRCRSTVRPQESPWGQVQPHPWLNSSWHAVYMWSLTFIPHLHPSLYRRNPIWCRMDRSLLRLPKCIVLIPVCWKLICTVSLFVLSTLCIFIHTVQSLPTPRPPTHPQWSVAGQEHHISHL